MKLNLPKGHDRVQLVGLVLVVLAAALWAGAVPALALAGVLMVAWGILAERGE